MSIAWYFHFIVKNLISSSINQLKVFSFTGLKSSMVYIVFQVACMQFINIVVHSVEDMNFRVHLQYDFTKLGLDEYLDVSKLQC